MRLLVFFDLPVKNNKDRRAYQVFRQYLLKKGYTMVQFSIYARVCKGQDSVNTHISYLKKMAPSKGNIRAMSITEKQYANMEIIVGNAKKAEQMAGKQLLLF